MSTGKRLAKRSIVSTRVCAPGGDGKYYAATIQGVRTPPNYMDNTNCINLNANTRYTVMFDKGLPGYRGHTTGEFSELDLIGPGFRPVLGLELMPGQRCFVTHNGREVAGVVTQHHIERDEVIIEIHPQGSEERIEMHKRLDEVRLLESRKSARLADSDTDFARLADMGGDRKRTASNTIDVPMCSNGGSRKRRPSSSPDDSQMDECNAALVLLSLSQSPRAGLLWNMGSSPESALGSSPSSRSTPSPSPSRGNSPPTGSMSFDDGVILDLSSDECPRKKKNTSQVTRNCTYPQCMYTTSSEQDIKYHLRSKHSINYGEEDFYFNDIDEEEDPISPAPTLSHRDMARPPHEDPEYQRNIVTSFRQTFLPSPIPNYIRQAAQQRPRSPKMPASPRRVRGENKKCRKIHGMERRELWCTQCRWKKACTRYNND